MVVTDEVAVEGIAVVDFRAAIDVIAGLVVDLANVVVAVSVASAVSVTVLVAGVAVAATLDTAMLLSVVDVGGIVVHTVVSVVVVLTVAATVVPSTCSDGLHWEYQASPVHALPATQQVGPAHPAPPHCFHNPLHSAGLVAVLVVEILTVWPQCWASSADSTDAQSRASP